MIKFVIDLKVKSVTLINKDMISGIDIKKNCTEIICGFTGYTTGLGWRIKKSFKEQEKLLKVINTAALDNINLKSKRQDAIIITGGTDHVVSIDRGGLISDINSFNNTDELILTLDKILGVGYTKRENDDGADVTISLSDGDWVLISVLFKVDEWIDSIFGKYITDTFEG